MTARREIDPAERFSFAPLEAAARRGNPAHINAAGRGCPHCTRLGSGSGNEVTSAVCVTDHQVAERLGINERQVYRLRHIGLTADAADQLAVRLGHHPVEVWPSEWLQVEWTDEPELEEAVAA